jgi:hypothetical protein
MLRNPSEKNKDNYEHRWPFLFNSVIDGLSLRELEMSGRRFTWANALPNPTYEKLDRILVSTEQQFPLANVIALSRDISDHTPLLLDTGRAPVSGNQPLFKFELGWLLCDGFADMVQEIWESVTDEVDSMRHWQAKIRRLHQHLRGWAKNVSGANRKEKKGLLDKLDLLEKKAEVSVYLFKKQI